MALAEPPIGPGGEPVTEPPVAGYTTDPAQPAVQGFNVDHFNRRGPLGVIVEKLPGSGAYGLLGGVDEGGYGQHAGVYGTSDQQGVFGFSYGAGGAGVFGINNSAGFGVRAEVSKGGTAVSGKSLDNSGPAAVFEGTVKITGEVKQAAGDVTIDGGGLALTTGSINVAKGDITLAGGGLALTTGSINVAKGDITLAGADCAEDFDAAPSDSLAPGMVVVIGEDGRVRPSNSGYDKTVVGIISGAGIFQPGMILGRQFSSGCSVPLALIGRVNCYVDADYSSIEIGDLLTTSPTSGHAMKADDPVKAFGAVIGKALAPLRSGRQLVPVLVALQ